VARKVRPLAKLGPTPGARPRAAARRRAQCARRGRVLPRSRLSPTDLAASKAQRASGHSAYGTSHPRAARQAVHRAQLRPREARVRGTPAPAAEGEDDGRSHAGPRRGSILSPPTRSWPTPRAPASTASPTSRILRSTMSTRAGSPSTKIPRRAGFTRRAVHRGAGGQRPPAAPSRGRL